MADQFTSPVATLVKVRGESGGPASVRRVFQPGEPFEPEDASEVERLRANGIPLVSYTSPAPAAEPESEPAPVAPAPESGGENEDESTETRSGRRRSRRGEE